MSTRSTSIDAPAAVRAGVLVLVLIGVWIEAVVFAALGVFGFGLVAWTMLVTIVLLVIVGAFCVFEVRVPAHRVHARWRPVNAFQELFIGGLGGLFLWMGLAVPFVVLMLLSLGDDIGEAAAGIGPALAFTGLGALLLGLRPTAVLDASNGSARWHFLGPAVPLFRTIDTSRVVLAADMARRGWIFRGRMQGGILGFTSFQLEHHLGPLTSQQVNERLHHWSQRFGMPARYR